MQDSLSFQVAERGFVVEIGKHVVTQFSILNLHLTTKGHAFGAFVLCLLGMHCLREIHNFNIVVSRSEVTYRPYIIGMHMVPVQQNFKGRIHNTLMRFTFIVGERSMPTKLSL